MSRSYAPSVPVLDRVLGRSEAFAGHYHWFVDQFPDFAAFTFPDDPDRTVPVTVVDAALVGVRRAPGQDQRVAARATAARPFWRW